MTGLELRGVSKVHAGGVVALKPLDLSIRPGEFVVLAGPSGCGKSTLLRLIAGLDQPTSGDILLDGKSIAALPPAERDVAMVFQSYALYPHMTVAENIGFGLRMRKVPSAQREAIVEETAALLGLTDLLGRRPGQLSGGQQQRVAVGRAIVRKPRLFLFDEPLSNLDAALRASTRAELRRLHFRLGATMLYVTHDQVEAMSMADRLVVMLNGAVQQVGTPLEVYEQPVNRFVAGFIGTPPMNFLEAEVARGVLHLSGAHQASGMREGKVVAGFRAESLEISESPCEGALAVTVMMTEMLGNETLVTCLLPDGQQAVVRTTDRIVGAGGVNHWLSLRWDHARFFEPDSGQNIGTLLDPFARDAAHQIALQKRK